MLEPVVAEQLQVLLDETDYLDPFQSGFRPGYGMETVLVTLFDYLCWEKDREFIPVDSLGPLNGFEHHQPWCPG